MAAILCLALLAGCGEEFANGYVWATNDSGQDVLVRHSDSGQSPRVWRVPGHSFGMIVSVNHGTLEALDPISCAVLATHTPVMAYGIGVVVDADGTASIKNETSPPEDQPAYAGPKWGSPQFTLVSDCVGPPSN